MKERNIIWFVVDGVRSYRSGIDDRDKIDIMDELAEECVEFENAFTSTPSSVLSASTMFTGLPSAYISRHYNDFEFDENEIDSIVTILEKRGYSIYSIFDAKALRCGLHTMAHSLPAKYRPKTSDHDKWWHNAEITKNVDHLFKENHVKRPSFFLMWYNCRKDPKTTDHVKNAIEIFKENGMWDDSIVIMNSDHGYPDPSTGLTVEYMKKYSHDMIVTDDNSRIPLILKYPNCPKGMKVNNLVRTSDIFHTLLELLELDVTQESKMNYSSPYRGKSLLNLINKQEDAPRIARIDTRLGMATSRTTALRSDAYKYVYHVDQDKHEFYDIVKDPYEMKDIVSSEDATIQSEIEKFKRLYNDQEEDIFNYHNEILKENLRKEIKKHFKEDSAFKVKSVLLTCTPTTPYIVLNLLVDYLRMSFSELEIDLVIPEKIDKKYQSLPLREIISVEKIDVNEFKKSSIVANQYDFVLYLTEGSRYNYIDPLIIKAIKLLNSKKIFMMDYNFRMYSHMLSKWIYPIKRLIRRNLKYYKGESLGYIVKDLSVGIKDGIKVNFLNKREQAFDTERIKQMRDQNMVNSENPVAAIHIDREKDRLLRLKSKEKKNAQE